MKNQPLFFVLATSFLYKIMPTNLLARKAGFYTSYIISEVKSTIRRCLFIVQSSD